MCRVLANHTCSTPPAVPEIPMAVVKQESSILDIIDSDNLLASLKQPGEAVFIDIDAFEYENILKGPKMSAAAYEGYVINFPDGKSPHTVYPFALHDTIILPWDYTLKNGVMKLFACSCRGLSGGSGVTCQLCRHLAKSETLESILTQMEDSTHKNAGFAYHGFSGLQEILYCKNQLIEFYRLCGLNQAKKLLIKAAALSDQKRLLMAIVSGRAS